MCLYFIHLQSALEHILVIVYRINRIEEGRSAIKILTCKPIGKRPIGRLRRIWENNITIDLKEVGINTRNWIDLLQETPCKCGIEPVGFISHGVG